LRGAIVRPDDDDDDDDDWKKVIEQIFQDRDGGDSDVEVGYDESITEDVIGDEQPNLLTLTADDGELQDDLDANDSQLVDADDSQLDVLTPFGRGRNVKTSAFSLRNTPLDNQRRFAILFRTILRRMTISSSM